VKCICWLFVYYYKVSFTVQGAYIHSVILTVTHVFFVEHYTIGLYVRVLLGNEVQTTVLKTLREVRIEVT